MERRAEKQQLGFDDMVEEVAASETEFKQVHKVSLLTLMWLQISHHQVLVAAPLSVGHLATRLLGILIIFSF